MVVPEDVVEVEDVVVVVEEVVEVGDDAAVTLLTRVLSVAGVVPWGDDRRLCSCCRAGPLPATMPVARVPSAGC